MPRGSKDLAEMAERMRAVGYDEHEIAEEVELTEALRREGERNTRLMRETGAFSPPDPPILRESMTLDDALKTAGAAQHESAPHTSKAIPYAALTEEQTRRVDSAEPMHRIHAAEQRLGLDKLIDDPDWTVREAVAYAGYGLDKLAHDPDFAVRQVVAKKGHAHDLLINDPDWEVRAAVAESGFGLDKLADDAHHRVQVAVARTLDKQQTDLESWIKANPELCALQSSRDDVEYVPYAELSAEQLALVDSAFEHDREDAARAGYGLDILVSDPSPYVRKEVAEKGFGHERLAEDPAWIVRATVQNMAFPDTAPFAPRWAKLVELPEGWTIRAFDDGSGRFIDAEGNSHFSYDLSTREIEGISCMPGIDDDTTIAKEITAVIERKGLAVAHAKDTDVPVRNQTAKSAPLYAEVINAYQRGNGIQRTATIPLPATADEMHSALVAAGVYDPEHEELEIIGVEGLSVDLASVSEGTVDLAELNTLAKMISLNSRAATNAQAAIELGDMQVKDVEGLMNVIASADELPYHPYEYPLKGRTDDAGSPYDLTWSPERKYGETMLYLDAFPPLSHLLTEHPEIEHAFDIEEFGRQMSEGGDVLGADGYFEDADISVDLTSRYTYEDLREQIEAQWEVMHQDEPVEMVDRPVEEMEGYAAMLDTLREDPALVNLERGTVLTTYPDVVKGREGQPFIASADPNYLAKLVICAENLQQWARDQIGRHNYQDGMPADALTERASWLSDGTAALKELAESTLGPEGMANLREDRFLARGALEACELARKDRAQEGDALSPNEESSRLKAITEAISNVGKKAKERVAPTI